MGLLIYSANCSLDGYINDADGEFDWSAPPPEAFAFLNERLTPGQTELYGRRTYELMTVWETDPSLAASGEHERTFADWWIGAAKIVYSTTLPQVVTGNTRLERDFDPVAVRLLKAESTGNLGIFGPTLAAHAFEAGLVDEVHLYVKPLTVGGGARALPPVALTLDLMEERRFTDGTVYLRYAVRS